jgi:hypothetical protein
VADRSDSRSLYPAQAARRRVPQGPLLFRGRAGPGSGSGQRRDPRPVRDLNDALKLKSITAYGGFNLNPVNYDNDGEAALIQKNLIHYNDQYATQEIQLNGDYGALTFTSGLFYLHERFFVQRDGYSRRNALATDPAAPRPTTSSPAPTTSPTPTPTPCSARRPGRPPSASA